MAKTGKAGAAAGKSTGAGNPAVKTAKTRKTPAPMEASPLPFAHRTPSQLHASTYLLKQG